MKELIKQLVATTMDKQILTFIAAALIFVAIMVALYFIFRKKPRADWDGMEGHEFEYFCAEVLKKNGFEDVVVTKASGDFGLDILAEKDGVTYGIQCKSYSSSVGIKAVQEVYAGKDFYDRMVGAVMTNQYFTQPAIEAATKLKVLLWDRDVFEIMLRNADMEE